MCGFRARPPQSAFLRRVMAARVPCERSSPSACCRPAECGLLVLAACSADTGNVASSWIDAGSLGVTQISWTGNGTAVTGQVETAEPTRCNSVGPKSVAFTRTVSKGEVVLHLTRGRGDYRGSDTGSALKLTGGRFGRCPQLVTFHIWTRASKARMPPRSSQSSRGSRPALRLLRKTGGDQDARRFGRRGGHSPVFAARGHGCHEIACRVGRISWCPATTLNILNSNLRTAQRRRCGGGADYSNINSLASMFNSQIDIFGTTGNALSGATRKVGDDLNAIAAANPGDVT